MYFDNLEDVKQYANEIICFYSDNDTYVKYEVKKYNKTQKWRIL